MYLYMLQIYVLRHLSFFSFIVVTKKTVRFIFFSHQLQLNRNQYKC